jgi:hypothetical protein
MGSMYAAHDSSCWLGKPYAIRYACMHMDMHMHMRTECGSLSPPTNLQATGLGLGVGVGVGVCGAAGGCASS